MDLHRINRCPMHHLWLLLAILAAGGGDLCSSECQRTNIQADDPYFTSVYRPRHEWDRTLFSAGVYGSFRGIFLILCQRGAGGRTYRRCHTGSQSLRPFRHLYASQRHRGSKCYRLRGNRLSEPRDFPSLFYQGEARCFDLPYPHYRVLPQQRGNQQHTG